MTVARQPRIAADQQLLMDHIFKFSTSFWLLRHGRPFSRPLDSTS